MKMISSFSFLLVATFFFSCGTFVKEDSDESENDTGPIDHCDGLECGRSPTSNEDCGTCSYNTELCDEGLCVSCEGTECSNSNWGALDVNSGLCWQEPPEDMYFSWEEAVNYCESLNLCGSIGWTLPSADDYMDLLGDCETIYVDYLNCNSCNGSETCGPLLGDDDNSYWTSTPEYRGAVFYVNTAEGWIQTIDLNSGGSLRARCVRQN